MAVPASISDLSTTAASNSPAGSDSISSSTGPDDYLRAHAAIIKTLAGSVTTDIASAVSTGISTHTAASDPHPLYALESALGTASTKATGTTAGTVPLVGTKSATELLAGLVELATQVEAEAGTDNTVVMTALRTAQAIAALGTGIGYGQTWQTVTRGSGTTYTNSTGKPIFVSVVTTANNTGGGGATLVVSGITVASSVGLAGAIAMANNVTISAIVPNGEAYTITGLFTAVTELR